MGNRLDAVRKKWFPLLGDVLYDFHLQGCNTSSDADTAHFCPLSPNSFATNPLSTLYRSAANELGERARVRGLVLFAILFTK